MSRTLEPRPCEERGDKSSRESKGPKAGMSLVVKELEGGQEARSADRGEEVDRDWITRALGFILSAAGCE